MKFYLLSDNVDTKTGMRLAGIEGEVIHEEEEFKASLDRICEDKDVAILLITEKLVNLCPKYVSEKKISTKVPIIIELPDRHGSERPDDYILDYVKDAIGVKL